MTKEIPAKKQKFDYLQAYSSVHPYDASNIKQAFQDMRDQMKPSLDSRGFYDAATSIGTHAPKLVCARTTAKAILLKNSVGNRPSFLAGSGNGARAPYMKVLLRPIAIKGQDGEASLISRLLSNCPTSTDLMVAFEQVFGSAACDELTAGLNERLESNPISLNFDNHPVFFVPGEDNSDLQVSPAGSIESHTNMKTLKIKMRARAKEDRLAKNPTTYGSWSDLSFSDKPQNLIVGAPSTRVRFRATFPNILREDEAGLWNYKSGGRFPKLKDEDVAHNLISYALTINRLKDADEYRDGNVALKQDRRAYQLIKAAQNFKRDVLDQLKDIQVEATFDDTPSTRDILARVPLKRAIESRRGGSATLSPSQIIAALNSPHFFDSLTKIGEEAQ
jgi:hypothetical protein